MARLLPALLLPFALLLVACGGGGGGGGGTTPTPPPPTGLVIGEVPTTFSLPDVNPASASFGGQVATDGSLGRASAWYFGWAT